MSEEKSKQAQPYKKEKKHSYIEEEEGNQGVAFTSRMIAEDDVS